MIAKKRWRRKDEEVEGETIEQEAWKDVEKEKEEDEEKEQEVEGGMK